MKTEEGWLRYDSDLGWCFDAGWSIVPILDDMTLWIRPWPLDRYRRGRLHETSDGGCFVVFGGQRKDRQWLHTLDSNKMYSAGMDATAPETIIDQARLADFLASDQEDDLEF